MQTISNGEAGSSVRAKLNADLNTAFSTLTDGASVTWDCNNRKISEANITSTQSFTINMTNVLDGSIGFLKLITGTASAITITFDTDFTNKRLGATGEETFTTYTFPASNAKEYILNYVVEGTVIHWVIGDANAYTNTRPYCKVRRTTNQSINDITSTAISFDTETVDNSSMWAVSPNPTRIVIPGTGNKIAKVVGLITFAASTTGIRRAFGSLNGSINAGAGVQINAASDATVETYINFSFIIECAAGDYIEILAYQKTGGSLNVTSCTCNVEISDR